MTQEKFQGDREYKRHLSGEMSLEEVFNRLKKTDKDHLKNLILPAIKDACEIANLPCVLFFVGSLVDEDTETYRDVDAHLVPKIEATTFTIDTLNKLLIQSFRKRTKLYVAVHEKNNIKIIFAGVQEKVLGIKIPKFEGACFEILLPYVNIATYEERVLLERKSGQSYSVLEF